jgi:hypothetical protein
MSSSRAILLATAFISLLCSAEVYSGKEQDGKTIAIYYGIGDSILSVDALDFRKPKYGVFIFSRWNPDDWFKERFETILSNHSYKIERFDQSELEWLFSLSEEAKSIKGRPKGISDELVEGFSKKHRLCINRTKKYSSLCCG